MTWIEDQVEVDFFLQLMTAIAGKLSNHNNRTNNNKTKQPHLFKHTIYLYLPLMYMLFIALSIFTIQKQADIQYHHFKLGLMSALRLNFTLLFALLDFTS